MRIHFLRNATLIIHSGNHRILLDPMLGRRGSLPPYTVLRHKPQLNPTVPLPENGEAALEKVTAVLITHCRWGHFDHLDPTGWRFAAQKQLPVYCSRLDNRYLKRRKLQTVPLTPNQSHEFLGGTIMPVTAVHGHGLVGRLMGPGVGYLIRLPNEPALYISGDTVLTDTVCHILTEQKPDVAILAAGTASIDVGRPILMGMPEMLEFVRLAPGKVIANHMEALNHCPTTRAELETAVSQANLQDKLIIPQNGDIFSP